MSVDLTRLSPGRSVGGIGVLVAATGLGWATSPFVGILFGFGVGSVWIVSPAFAFGAAHLGLLAVPSLGTAVGFLTVEAGLLLALAGPIVRGRLATTIVGATGAALLGLLVVLWVGLDVVESVPITAVLVAVVAATVGYLLDRYVQVRLGQIGGEA